MYMYMCVTLQLCMYVFLQAALVIDGKVSHACTHVHTVYIHWKSHVYMWHVYWVCCTKTLCVGWQSSVCIFYSLSHMLLTHLLRRISWLLHSPVNLSSAAGTNREVSTSSSMACFPSSFHTHTSSFAPALSHILSHLLHFPLLPPPPPPPPSPTSLSFLPLPHLPPFTEYLLYKRQRLWD